MKKAIVILMSVLMALLIMSCEKDAVLTTQDDALLTTELRTDSPTPDHRPAWRFTTQKMKNYIMDMVNESVMFGKYGKVLILKVEDIEERIAKEAIASAKKEIKIFESDVEAMVEKQYFPASYAQPLYRMSHELEFILDGKLIVFEDSFESYETGTFPYRSGWDLYFRGRGEEYQGVSDAVAAYGAKSLKLEGRLGWSATAFKEIEDAPEIVFVETKVLVHKPQASTVNLPKAGFGLINMEEGLWGTRYAFVTFAHDGYIYFDAFRTKAEKLQAWQADKWYNFRIKYNKLTKMANIWVNGELMKENVNLRAPDGFYAGLLLDSGRDTYTTTFFDDVRVWKLVP